MESLILLVLSILPVVILGAFIYRNDKLEKEPISLLVVLIIAGVLSTILTLILTGILYGLFPFFNTDYAAFDVIAMAIYVFCGIAIIEEFSKWIFTYTIAWRNKAFNHVYDAIVYSVFVSLGFAGIENILYVFGTADYSQAITTAFLRMFLSIPGHAFFGVMMGYYLGLAKLTYVNNIKNKSRSYLVLSILVPAICHFFFDYLLMIDSPLFYVYVVFLYIIAFKHVKKLSNVTTKIVNNSNPSIPVNNQMNNNYVCNTFSPNIPKYCTNCGSKLIGPYCTNCGHKNY